MARVHALIPWFLTLQAATLLPALPAGAEVRIVSTDLMRVYLVGRVDDAGTLRLEGELPPPGSEARLLAFPPESDAEADAAAASGAAAWVVRVDPDGTVLVDGGNGPVPLREALAERDVRLLLPGEEGP